MENPFDTGYYYSDELRSFGFARVGENVAIAKNCTIIGLQHIEIGDHVRIDGFTTMVASAPLTFGSHVHIGGGCHFVAAEPLAFGSFGGTSQGVKIYTASDDYTGRALMGPMVPPEYRNPTRRPISIGDYAVLGANAVLLPGANMAEGSVLGAQSLAMKPLEPWSIYFGSPAARLKTRSQRCRALAAEIEARHVAAA